MRRSKKNYYKYRFTKKRKNNRKLIKFLIFLFFLFLLYSLPKVSNVVNKFFSNYFTIKDIEILENNTTVPNEIIIEFFLKNKVSLFNFKKLIKNLLKTYPEIKKVKVAVLPVKELKIKIISKIPVFFLVNKEIFISNDGEEFKVYNINKINFDRLLKIECDNYDIKKLKDLYQIFVTTNLTKEIQKICIKNNGEYIIFTNKQTKVILDEKFSSIKKNFLVNMIKISLEKNTDVYGRVADAGIVYIK